MKKAMVFIILGLVIGAATGGYGGYVLGGYKTWDTALEAKAAHYDPLSGERRWGASTYIDSAKKLPANATDK